VRGDGAQLAVEVFSPRLRAVRMAGVLDRVTVARLAAVVKAQLGRPGCTGHIVVDLGEVGFFGTDDVSELLAVRDAAQARGVHVHVAGITARESLLPLAISAAFAQFSSFPTLEQAEVALVGRPVTAAVPG
jgi:ABC-type transporter Mla MlaB component